MAQPDFKVWRLNESSSAAFIFPKPDEMDGPNRYNITNQDRLANGLSVADLIKKNIEFNLTWKNWESVRPDGKGYIAFLEKVWNTNQIFFNFEFPMFGTARQCIVYFGALPNNVHQTYDGSASNYWVLKDVKLHIIER